MSLPVGYNELKGLKIILRSFKNDIILKYSNYIYDKYLIDKVIQITTVLTFYLSEFGYCSLCDKMTIYIFCFYKFYLRLNQKLFPLPHFWIKLVNIQKMKLPYCKRFSHCIATASAYVSIRNCIAVICSNCAGIRVHGLRKEFPKVRGEGVVAVDRVSFSAFHGEITTLLGHNGAGKTTTMSG